MRSEIGKRHSYVGYHRDGSKDTRASDLDVQSEDRLLACLGRRASLLVELRQANRQKPVLRVGQGCLTSNDALDVFSLTAATFGRFCESHLTSVLSPQVERKENWHGHTSIIILLSFGTLPASKRG
jgi:hypothetical protein